MRPARTAIEHSENISAHLEAGAEIINGKPIVIYKGERYSYKEFDKMFPIHGFVGAPNVKGENNDGTKRWLED